LKEIIRPTYPDQVDSDEKILRQYIRLACGDEAASLMREASQFGAILFGTDGDDA
jgi:hypothetical protein